MFLVTWDAVLVCIIFLLIVKVYRDLTLSNIKSSKWYHKLKDSRVVTL